MSDSDTLIVPDSLKTHLICVGIKKNKLYIGVTHNIEGSDINTITLSSKGSQYIGDNDSYETIIGCNAVTNTVGMICDSVVIY